ncbi:hypothetical protein Mal4_18440 [Maioricimonas rarisocia]|uniref:Kelch motif protein n=1 Tax=Maioricimonas rarisocia TaxID=2528026 RepID=A0A517Z4W9_9PLAN|nr:hypothetical protein [Maioricimonas rarisocia]QDU37530.1 hypothetical protein Mal4_18440 [Maioricimonas rarisocia]
MSLRIPLLLPLLFAVVPPDALPADEPQPFRATVCEGRYPHHLQGICTDQQQSLYWSFTTVLVKTDSDGKVQKQIDVANHHGDLCYHDGKVYVAVNLGQFNRPAGQADSWVYVYDAKTLEELARHEVPEVVHGAGGMACHEGRFIVVGGLPPGYEENYLYEYDADFNFQKRHVFESGYTLMGIQTAAYADGAWWFGCYGNPPTLLKANEKLEFTGKWNFNCSLGIVALEPGRLLVASGHCRKEDGCDGRVEPAVADEKQGLRRVSIDSAP